MRVIERAKEISKEKGIAFSFISKKLGKSPGYLAEILSNGRDINPNKVAELSNILGVPVSALTGETSPANKIENIPDVAAFDGFAGESSDEIKNQVEALYVYRTLTPEEIELIRNYRKASQKNKNIVLTLLEEEDK